MFVPSLSWQMLSILAYNGIAKNAFFSHHIRYGQGGFGNVGGDDDLPLVSKRGERLLLLLACDL
jgi:hypothetical protein